MNDMELDLHVQIPAVPDADFKWVNLSLLVGVVAGLACLVGMVY